MSKLLFGAAAPAGTLLLFAGWLADYQKQAAVDRLENWRTWAALGGPLSSLSPALCSIEPNDPTLLVWLVALLEQVAQRAYGLHGCASLRITEAVSTSVVAKKFREELVSRVAVRPACFSEHHESITGFDVIAHFELTEFRQVLFLGANHP